MGLKKEKYGYKKDFNVNQKLYLILFIYIYFFGED